MNTSKLVAIILAAALIASVIANVYLITQNSPSNDTTKVEMVNILNQIQVQADVEIDCMGQSLIYASEDRKSTRLNSSH
jgi:hypothetical protein